VDRRRHFMTVAEAGTGRRQTVVPMPPSTGMTAPVT
jgi:hypothetical protein